MSGDDKVRGPHREKILDGESERSAARRIRIYSESKRKEESSAAGIRRVKAVLQ